MLNFKIWDNINILKLSSIDSTNTHALRLIKTGQAGNGTWLQAQVQTAGRGQRNKEWFSGGQDLYASLCIDMNGSSVEAMPLLSYCVALSIRQLISTLSPNQPTLVKWPNDVYHNNKKIAGILIENIWQANHWQFTIVGMGINVNSRNYPDNIGPVTSLAMATGLNFDLDNIRDELLILLTNFLRIAKQSPTDILAVYNDFLYTKNELVSFLLDGEEIQAVVKGVDIEGRMHIDYSGKLTAYPYGKLVQKKIIV